MDQAEMSKEIPRKKSLSSGPVVQSTGISREVGRQTSEKDDKKDPIDSSLVTPEKPRTRRWSEEEESPSPVQSSQKSQNRRKIVRPLILGNANVVVNKPDSQSPITVVNSPPTENSGLNLAEFAVKSGISVPALIKQFRESGKYEYLDKEGHMRRVTDLDDDVLFRVRCGENAKTLYVKESNTLSGFKKAVEKLFGGPSHVFRWNVFGDWAELDTPQEWDNCLRKARDDSLRHNQHLSAEVEMDEEVPAKKHNLKNQQLIPSKEHLKWQKRWGEMED